MTTRYDDSAEFAFRCEIRAVEEGHRAFMRPGGSIKVVSDSRPGITYTVQFFGRLNGEIWFVCDCPSGKNRSHLPVPCKHSALAGRRLVRENIATRHPVTNLFVVRDGLTARVVESPATSLDDPFKGLPS